MRTLTILILFASSLCFGQDAKNYHSIVVKGLSYEEALDTIVSNGFGILSYNQYTATTFEQRVKVNDTRSATIVYVVTKTPQGARFSVRFKFGQPIDLAVIGSTDKQNRVVPMVWSLMEEMLKSFGKPLLYIE